MTARHATRNALLTYLRTVGEPRPVQRVIRYMRQMHRVEEGATRTQLWRLCQAGLAERVDLGWYQIGTHNDS